MYFHLLKRESIMAKNNEIKKIQKKNEEVSKYDFIICPNCGAEEVGKFCPNCGQSNKDFSKPLKEIMGDLLDSINLDIRLLNTLIPFFTKPGFLTQEYFKGKRKKYVPPMRMYILFSVLFFFLAQFINLEEFRGLGKVTEDAVTDSLKQEIAIAKTGANNMSADAHLKPDTMVVADENSFKGPKIINNEDSDSNLVTTFNELTTDERKDIIQEIESDTALSEGIKKVVIGGLNISEKIDMFWEKFLKNISYVLFLLMPFFALILALTLWKSRLLYVHHLIFSINFHSFVFGFSSVLIILGLIFKESAQVFTSYLLLGYPLYLMVGIKRFYNRPFIGSFFKTLGILLLYLLIIFIVIIIILAITAQGFYEV